ncbi:MAG: NTP transferase domain-containing protein [Flavobacteriales bacterium]
MAHEKHPKLTKSAIGRFARHELGFFGAQCAEIHDLAARLSAHLSDFTKVYVDANHTALDQPDYINRSSAHFEAELTNEMGQFTWAQALHNAAYSADDARPDQFDLLGFRHGLDLALINANHFTPAVSVLVWRAERADKVLKRTEQLAACEVVMGATKNEVPEKVLGHLREDVLFLGMDDLAGLVAWVRKRFPPPPLRGLVLAGGRSSRMGRDKSRMHLHGTEQFKHAMKLLEPHCGSVHLSVSNSQDFPEVANALADRFTGLGPFGALLTAFMYDPNAAWLVLAVDLPLVDHELLSELVAARQPAHMATAFVNLATGFPDPLCTIWEPKSYGRLLAALADGWSCPRKVLINSNSLLIHPKKPEKLANANTPDDLKKLGFG